MLINSEPQGAQRRQTLSLRDPPAPSGSRKPEAGSPFPTGALRSCPRSHSGSHLRMIGEKITGATDMGTLSVWCSARGTGPGASSAITSLVPTSVPCSPASLGAECQDHTHAPEVLSHLKHPALLAPFICDCAVKLYSKLIDQCLQCDIFC